MSSDGAPAIPCPGCQGPLELEQSEGARRYRCPGCGGMMCGVAVFRTVAGTERAEQAWRAAVAGDAGGAGGTCPFCGQAMRVAAGEHGRVSACRTCEMVWVDSAALASFAGGPAEPAEPAAAAEPSVPAEPQRCANCGAPVQHTWDEKCQYCGAALAPPTKVVVLKEESPTPATGAAHFWQEVGEALDADASGRLHRGWWRDL